VDQDMEVLESACWESATCCSVLAMKTKSALPILNAAIALCLTGLIGLSVTALAQSVAAADAYKIEETRLGPWDTQMSDFAFSSDGRHFAYLSSHECQKSGTRCVIVDGQVKEETRDVREGTLALSPDGKRVAYAAKRDERWSLVVDGQAGAQYDDIEVGSPVFSPDSKRIAFVAKVGGRYSIVVDGQAGAEYDEILNPARGCRADGYKGARNYYCTFGLSIFFFRPWMAAVQPTNYTTLGAAPVFSPDSKRVAYAARNGKRWSVVVDGQVGAEFDRIPGLPVFSPDSKRFAYTGLLGKQGRLVVDGKDVGLDYDQSGSPVFSPDGKGLAYLAERGKQSFVVVDGQPCLGLGGYVGGPVVFSPDGKRLTYLAGRKKQAFFMVDGQPVAEYIGFGPLLSPRISPDGKHMAYVADVSPREGSKKEVVEDGQVVAMNYHFGAPNFSPDSKHLAYVAGSTYEKGMSVVVDGKASGGYQYVLNGSPSFGPDGVLEVLMVKKEGLYRVKYIPTP
jgi:Tol biopolymer transport system component